MDTIPSTVSTVETDHLWLASSASFPRITVTGETEADAVRTLEERRVWWLSLDGEDE